MPRCGVNRRHALDLREKIERATVVGPVDFAHEPIGQLVFMTQCGVLRPVQVQQGLQSRIARPLERPAWLAR